MAPTRRADLLWTVALAALAVVGSRLFGFDWPTTIVAVSVVSAGRLTYAWYARRTWR